MSPLLFLCALFIGWIRLRAIRSLLFWRFIARVRDAFALWIVTAAALERLLFTERGRLRKRRDIERDVLEAMLAEEA